MRAPSSQASLLLPLLLTATKNDSITAFQQQIRKYSQHVPLERMIPLRSSTTESIDNGSDTIVEFPPPLSGFERTKRAIEFYKRTLPVLAAYKAKEIELKFKPEKSKENEEQIWNELDEWGSTRIAETIQEMKGFYVKTGQVISTRVDLFPPAYTEKLQALQDGIEPMPYELVEAVVRQELLDGAPLSDLFLDFEKEPLGAASIAQVHKATLLDGRTVAVKLQRPNVEPKLLGDVANLKRISKALAKNLPVDYYTVFSELGDALVNELDFLAESQAMRKIDYAISHCTDGTAAERPVTVPLPVGELVSKRVLVMDFVEGVPLNRLQQTMKEKGIEPGSPESKLAGRRILNSLSSAFGRMIFGAGFIHGDPHPGNIFIGEGGKVSLIDCGQFKALPRMQRVQLAEVILAVDKFQKAAEGEEYDKSKTKLAGLIRSFGVKLMEEHEDDDDLAAAVALFLFGDADRELPGGYSTNELDERSPIKLISSFPQEFVLLGRATVLLKGIAKRLDVPFSLAEKWRKGCALTLSHASSPQLPLWGKELVDDFSSGGGLGTKAAVLGKAGKSSKVKFSQVASLFKMWGKGKIMRFFNRVVKKLPDNLKMKVIEAELKRQEAKEAIKD